MDASTGGSLNDKIYDAVRELFQRISDNGSIGYSERANTMKKRACKLEMDATMGLEVHMSMITNKMNVIEAKLEGKTGETCGLCQRNHFTD